MKVLEVADGLEREVGYAAGIGGEDEQREEGNGRWAEESGVGMSVGWDAYVGKMSVDVSVLTALTVFYVHISFPGRMYHHIIKSCNLTLSVDMYGKCKYGSVCKLIETSQGCVTLE